MGFNESMGAWAVMLVTLVIFTAVNQETLTDILTGVKATLTQMLILSLHILGFLFVLAILGVKPARDGFNKAVEIVFSYPSKLLGKFFS